jgi:uncharacterized protein YfiM (DUF2279 family)
MMKGLVLVFSLGSTPQQGDGWLTPDKIQHFFTSAFVQSMTYGSLRATGLGHGASIAGATAAAAAAGVGKEIHDGRVKGEFSYRDLAWDAAGAGAVSLLLVRTVR